MKLCRDHTNVLWTLIMNFFLFNLEFYRINIDKVGDISLKQKCHFDEILINGCNVSCLNNNFQCKLYSFYYGNNEVNELP